jgi:hypothetical protein
MLIRILDTPIIMPNSQPPNGPALSCGADNFQVAENETSSC